MAGPKALAQFRHTVRFSLLNQLVINKLQMRGGFKTSRFNTRSLEDMNTKKNISSIKVIYFYRAELWNSIQCILQVTRHKVRENSTESKRTSHCPLSFTTEVVVTEHTFQNCQGIEKSATLSTHRDPKTASRLP